MSQTESDRLLRPVRRRAAEAGGSPLLSRLAPGTPILPAKLSPAADGADDSSIQQPLGVADLSSVTPTTGLLHADNEIRAQALAALEKLQTQSIDRKAQLRVFGLSLLAFVIVGWLLTIALKSSFTATTLIGLMLVLVIHEAGHYWAMRHFGYRNLKMFFIPLFGAAVSGYGHVPVVQESMVYLMGPLPGIFIGYGCGLLFLLTRQAAWRDMAEMFVLINALNLLPVYPLDGGRFVFGLLSPRTYRIQWLLQVLIMVGLFALTFAVHVSQLSSVAGIALGGILHLTRSNRLANRVRTSPIAQAASHETPIPATVAVELIDLMRSESEKPKAIAEYAWHAWTQATAKRPTPLETFGLAVIYALTWLSVIIAQAIYAELI